MKFLTIFLFFILSLTVHGQKDSILSDLLYKNKLIDSIISYQTSKESLKSYIPYLDTELYNIETFEYCEAYLHFGEFQKVIRFFRTQNNVWIDENHLMILCALNNGSINESEFTHLSIEKALKENTKGINKIRWTSDNEGIYNDCFIGANNIYFHCEFNIFYRSGFQKENRNHFVYLKDYCNDSVTNANGVFLSFTSEDVFMDKRNGIIDISRQRQVLISIFNRIVVSDSVFSPWGTLSIDNSFD
jgi:hypothetical protein